MTDNGQQRETIELEKLLDACQIENEKLCKQIKQIEQQHKKIEQSMFDENEKLRRELTQTRMSCEQHEHVRVQTREPLPDKFDDDRHETQRLRNELDRLTAHIERTRLEHERTTNPTDQRRIHDLERQVKELGRSTCTTSLDAFCTRVVPLGQRRSIVVVVNNINRRAQITSDVFSIRTMINTKDKFD
jgi:chromosome segregation ATPase